MSAEPITEVRTEMTAKEFLDMVQVTAKESGVEAVKQWADEHLPRMFKEQANMTKTEQDNLRRNAFRKGLFRPKNSNLLPFNQGKDEADGSWGTGEKMAELLPFFAKMKGGHSREAVASLARDKGYEGVAKALEASTFEAGGALIPEEYSADFITLIYSASAVRALGATVVDMRGGNLTIGKQDVGAMAYWVGEGQAIQVSQQTFGDVKLSAKRLGIAVPITNQLVDRMPAGMGQMLRDDLISAARAAEDQAFIRGQGTEYRPKGILHQTASGNKFNATGADTPTLAQVTLDLIKAEYKVEDADIPMLRTGWMFHPRIKRFLMSLRTAEGHPVYLQELAAGQLHGSPIVATTGIPRNLSNGGQNDNTEIYFGDFAQVVIGDTIQTTVDEAREASFVDAGGQTVHGFLAGIRLMKLEREVDLAMRRTRAFGIIENCRWGSALDA
jgi:HK97 family phage major capsid protein